MKKYWYTIGVFITKNYYKYMLLSLLAFLCSHCIFSYRNIDSVYAYKIIETYAILIGIVTYVPLFEMEQDIGIWALVKTKSIEMYKVYILRFGVAIITLATVISLFVWEIDYNSVEPLDIKQIWSIAVMEATFLGSIGLFVSAITNRVLIGMMISVTYYLINYWWSGKMGSLSLFYMLEGKKGFNISILISTAFIIIMAIMLREKFYCIAKRRQE